MQREIARVIESFSHGIGDSTRPSDREIVRGYLAALAPLLAAMVLGRSILGEIGAIDRLFGQTWVTDVDPFRDALAKWEAFKVEHRNSAAAAQKQQDDR